MLRQEGYEALGARRLAAEMGCSTMPLFRHFKSMEEIRAVAVEQATALYSEYIREGLSQPIPFKGVGRAYIRFAQEEPRLFKLFFMTPDSDIPALPSADPNYSAVADSAAKSSLLSGEQAERLYREMWLFVHGIATLAVTGKMNFEEEEISRILTDAYRGISEHLKKEEANP